MILDCIGELLDKYNVFKQKIKKRGEKKARKAWEKYLDQILETVGENPQILHGYYGEKFVVVFDEELVIIDEFGE